jgi:hypothetical protein
MAQQRAKEKAEKEQTEKVLYQGLKAGPSTSSQPRKFEKQKLSARDRMRGKQKVKPQKPSPYAPDEEQEDSQTEAELIAPTEDQNRFVASSKSPEPYSSAQNVKTSMSEDAVMATRSEIEVKSRDTIMSEYNDGLGGIEAAKTASLQPPLPLEETNELTTLVPSESGTLRPKPQTSKLPRGKKRQPTSAPIVDRVTRSVSLKQKGKMDTHLQPGTLQALLTSQ